MNNDQYRQHDDRTNIFDLNESAWSAWRARRAERQPALAGQRDRVRSSLRQPQAVPAVAIGLTALIAVGGLAAMTRTRASVAQASQAIDAPATVVDPPIGPDLNAATNRDEQLLQGEQLLFWGDLYVGHWAGDHFVAAQRGELQPNSLVGTEIELQNQSGATVSGTVAECNGDLVFDGPTPGFDSVDAFWYTDGAPFEVSATNTDIGARKLVSLLAEGLPVDYFESLGAPLAADGTADRLLWETNDRGSVNWIAVYDIETNTIRSVQGQAGIEPAGNEIGAPDGTWVDLDHDGNLESIHTDGDLYTLVEWATGQELWVAGPHRCR